jgi:transcriptional regulator with GAF, ATPase, and Fis domain
MAVDHPLRLSLFLVTECCPVELSPLTAVTLRRSPDPHVLYLGDPGVSARAEGIAELRLTDGSPEIVPFEETSPMLLNGSKLERPTELRVGDRIRVGHTTLVVQGMGTSAHGQSGDVKTMILRTEAIKQREPLEAVADRLAWWSQAFDAMREARDQDGVGSVILQQLLQLSKDVRAIVAVGRPPRELASRGFSAGDAERIARWLNRADSAAVQMPTLQELTEEPIARRAIVICHQHCEEDWFLCCDFESISADLETAYRVQSMLGSMLALFRSLHGHRRQERRVFELTETVRAYAAPLEDQLFDLVRSRFVFEGVAMERTCRALAQAAAAPSPVLLLGEPGTGKQLAAEGVHAASNRRHRDMVSVSLVEIPETLIESQLFGHVGKIFPGAREHHGLIAKANGGTLFLDEIGEVPWNMQAKLLRVLETGDYWRIGANRPSKVDLRLITATNRDLADAVRRGEFRQDLYDRISVIPITLPPLRERSEDVPVLVERFLDEFNRVLGKHVRFSSDAIQQLQQQPWPNNVRGLRRFVERVVVMTTARSRTVGPEGLRDFLPREQAGTRCSSLELVEQRLMEQGRANQSRILHELRLTNERQTKSVWGERVGLSRPVFRRELKSLIGFCLQHDIPLAFFQERLKLQQEDWEYLTQQASRKQKEG